MDWLIISYFTNISGMACSHHLDDRLEILTRKGVVITLLSAIFVDKNDRVRHLRVPSLSGGGLRFEVRQFMKKGGRSRRVRKIMETVALLPVFPFYCAEKILFNIDTTWLWFPLAFLRGYLHCLRSRPALIYSTGGPISAHLTAALLSRWTGIAWVAEFQDPLLHSYCARSDFELRLTRWAERVICKCASRVVFLTERARQTAAQRTELGNRGVVIYPGAPPEALAADYKPGKLLRLVHFGSLGGSRNLICLLQALALLVQELPELSSVIRITLYGNLGKDIRKQVSNFAYPEMVEVEGFVSRQQSVEVMKRSDVLLLIQNIDDVSKETIPSKAYEYFHTCRPVLGLLYRNRELRGMMECLGHHPVEADDVEEIRACLLSVVQRFSTGALPPVQESPFTVDAAVDKLLALSEPA